MVELTEREKKIVLIKYIIHGVSPYQEAPLDVREKMLVAALKVYGLKYEKNEMLDIGEAILKIQQEINDSALGFLKTNSALVDKALRMMGRGNDRFEILDR